MQGHSSTCKCIWCKLKRRKPAPPKPPKKAEVPAPDSQDDDDDVELCDGGPNCRCGRRHACVLERIVSILIFGRLLQKSEATSLPILLKMELRRKRRFSVLRKRVENALVIMVALDEYPKPQGAKDWKWEDLRREERHRKLYKAFQRVLWIQNDRERGTDDC